jgi:hypothetical protein
MSALPPEADIYEYTPWHGLAASQTQRLGVGGLRFAHQPYALTVPFAPAD